MANAGRGLSEAAQAMAQKALLEAVMRNDKRGVDLALSTGADLTHKDQVSSTFHYHIISVSAIVLSQTNTSPLGWACTRGIEEMVAYLAAKLPLEVLLESASYLMSRLAS